MIIKVIGIIILAPILLVMGFLGLLFGSIFLDVRLWKLESEIDLRIQQGKAPRIYQEIMRLLLGTLLYFSLFKGAPIMMLDPKDKSIQLNSHPHIEPNSSEWFTWLSRFYNNSFILCVPGAYDEREVCEAHKSMSGVWTATGEIHTRKHTFTIGHTSEVTSARLVEIVGMYDERLRKLMDNN